MQAVISFHSWALTDGKTSFSPDPPNCALTGRTQSFNTGQETHVGFFAGKFICNW